MKFRLLPLLILSLFLVSCKEEKHQGPSIAQYYAVIAENDSLVCHITELQDGLNTISLSLDSIDMQEGLLYVGNADGTRASRRQILDRIRNYRELLARQRQQIARLENSDNAVVHQLRGMLNRLKQEIEEKEEHIASLEKEIDSKKRDITKLQNDLTQTRQVVDRTMQQRDSLQEINEEQEKELYTGYYYIGRKAQLKRAGLVKGMFKSKADYASLKQERFTKIDTRKFTELPIRGTDVQLITEKPADSYFLFESTGGHTTLRITDPQKFWSGSPYLIVQYK